MKFQLFIVIFYCLSIGHLIAQGKTDSYWEADPDHVFFKLLYSPRHLQNTLSESGNPLLQANPLSRDLIGIGVYGLGIGAELYAPSPFRSSVEKELEADALFHDLQGAIFLPRFVLEYSHQSYLGWKDALSDLFLDRMKFREFRLTPMFILFGEKFSWKMPVNQSSQQLRSAGSPVIASELKFMKMRIAQIEDTALEFPIDHRWNGLIVWPGYAHTLVKGGWYVSAAAFGGLGLTSVIDVSRNGNEFRPASGIRWRAGAGFNDGKWLFGILYQSQQTILARADLNLESNNQLVKISAGYRFEAGNGMRNLRTQIPILRSF